MLTFGRTSLPVQGKGSATYVKGAVTVNVTVPHLAHGGLVNRGVEHPVTYLISLPRRVGHLIAN